MEINPQKEFSPTPERATRVLTSREFLDLNRRADFLETNIPALLEANPDAEVIITQTPDGLPLEIEIKHRGIRIFYDNLEFQRKLRIREQKPKETIH